MSNYDYQKQLQKVWEHAVEVYRKGVSGPDEMFTEAQSAFLASIGQNEQEMFDYAEDYANGGDPAFGDVAAVADIRRAYFLNVQGGKPSAKVINPDALPAKSAEVDDIAWLPRIIEKAKAKLRGELHPSVMYGCAGDRAFLRRCDIHSAELLRKVWEEDGNDAAVVSWVKERMKRA